jgi:hypothetical protein
MTYDSAHRALAGAEVDVFEPTPASTPTVRFAAWGQFSNCLSSSAIDQEFGQYPQHVALLAEPQQFLPGSADARGYRIDLGGWRRTILFYFAEDCVSNIEFKAEKTD